MSAFNREECLRRLRAQVAAGKPIIGGGAGTGISAKCAEAGGIDLIIIYNCGRFRMAGSAFRELRSTPPRVPIAIRAIGRPCRAEAPLGTRHR